MEEELQKQNTDCVYFLASPLTCKKGIECEYRHSEIARLNPRDCWYWLAGSCLNPTCAFRHPPVDVHAEASSESAPLSSQLPEPVTKTNVPCYFYFNGYCNKGDMCSFLHGSDGTPTSVKKSFKAISAITDALPLENKTSAGSNTGSIPIEVATLHPTSAQTALKAEVEIQSEHTEDLHESAPKEGRSVSIPKSVSEFEEAVAIKSDSLHSAEGFTQNRSRQSSEEQVDDDDDDGDDDDDDRIEPEERWESSPGFDVLVDNGSGNLGYEDEMIEREGRDLDNHFFEYAYEEPVEEYVPRYPDAGILYERGIYQLENEHDLEYDRKRSREMMPSSNRKRKFLSTARSGLDLREALRKRRVMNGTDFSRRHHDSSNLIGRIQERERPRRHHGGGGTRRLHGRLMSEAGNNNMNGSSLIENGNRLNGRFGHNSHRQHQHYNNHIERRLTRVPHDVTSEASSRKLVSRKKRTSTTRESTSSFTAPKTLAQIKEEKRRARENGDVCFGEISSTTLEDFQAPKPLSEILKDKRGMGSAMDGNISSN